MTRFDLKLLTPWLLAASVAMGALGCASSEAPTYNASTRAFPSNALRGQLEVKSSHEGTLNGQPVRFAPGLVMRGQTNTAQPPTTFVGERLAVHYVADGMGLVSQVWVLTPQEIGRTPWPRNAAEARAWTFDPTRQVWVR
jgi:hypothetical protein